MEDKEKESARLLTLEETQNSQKEEAARKILQWWARKSKGIVYLNSTDVTFFKKEISGYINFPKEDLEDYSFGFSPNRKKAHQLADAYKKEGAEFWKNPILLNEKLPFYAFRAWATKLIDFHTMNSIISYRNLIKDFGLEKLTTVPLLNGDHTSFSEEGKKYLIYFLEGNLLLLPSDQIQALFPDLEEPYWLTLVDITEYLRNARKENKSTLIEALQRTRLSNFYLELEDKTLLPVIHDNALDKIMKHFFGFSFHRMLGEFSRDMIREYQLKNLRLADQRFPGLSSLRVAHNHEGIKAIEASLHDMGYHTPAAGSVEAWFRNLLLNECYQITETIEKFFNRIHISETIRNKYMGICINSFGLKGAIVDLNNNKFYLRKFNKLAGGEYKPEDCLQDLFLDRKLDSHSIMVYFFFMKCHICLFPNSPINQKINFTDIPLIKGFINAFESIQKMLTEHGITELTDEKTLVVLIQFSINCIMTINEADNKNRNKNENKNEFETFYKLLLIVSKHPSHNVNLTPVLNSLSNQINCPSPDMVNTINKNCLNLIHSFENAKSTQLYVKR